MRWVMSHRFDRCALPLADRHYSRQKIGTPQFVSPGRNVVLLTDCARALWVTSWPRYARHRWQGAWVCTLFRNEGAGLATELIEQAISATIAHFGEPPPLGMITFIAPKFVKPTMVHGKAVYGWTFRKVGFVEIGHTLVHKRVVLQLTPDRMPEPRHALRPWPLPSATTLR